MSRTILLVEDNTDNRIIYRRALEHFGYTVIEALDGEEVIRLATERLPDLILMDISIPRIDGWEATRVIRADPRTKGIPVVALTAHAMVGERRKALEAGCDDFDTKPIDFAGLIAKVERLLHAKASWAAS